MKKKLKKKLIDCAWSGYCFDQKAFRKWRREGLKKRKTSQVALGGPGDLLADV